jgi:lipoprotein Spr
VFQLYKEIYNKVTPRTSKTLYEAATKISDKELQVGDLVFFNIDGRGISHVGVYIGENKFVHASSSKGVVLSLLSENYYKKHFVSFGRLR